jgi:uncharacterized protein YdeI (BOF family)
MRSAVGSRNRARALTSEMRGLSVSLACLLLAAGCGQPKGKVLGKSPKGEPQTILSVRAGTAPTPFTVTGVLIEKCPTAGCWFRLRDSTGVMRVDTKAAGFVVVGVPLESKITVAGKAVPDGNDVQIEATGIRY